MEVRVTQISNQGKKSASFEELTVKVIETITMSCLLQEKLSKDLFFCGEKGNVQRCEELLRNGANVNWKAGRKLVSSCSTYSADWISLPYDHFLSISFAFE